MPALLKEVKGLYLILSSCLWIPYHWKALRHPSLYLNWLQLQLSLHTAISSNWIKWRLLNDMQYFLDQCVWTSWGSTSSRVVSEWDWSVLTQYHWNLYKHSPLANTYSSWDEDGTGCTDLTWLLLRAVHCTGQCDNLQLTVCLRTLTPIS